MKIHFKIIIFFIYLTFSPKAQSNNVLTVAEKMPEFIGGTNALSDYIVKNLNAYLSDVVNHTGKAYVNFIVDDKGKVTNAKIIKSTGNQTLDEEAIRVIKTMPNWIAGVDSGKNVSVYVNMPIIFGGKAKVDPNDVPSGLSMNKGPKEPEPKVMTPEEKALEEKHKKAVYYNNLGVDQANQERYEFALAKFDLALKQDPTFRIALFNKADMHLKLRQKKEACETWSQYKALGYKSEKVEDLVKANCN